MEKYLVLEFTNAGFFKKHKGTKDFIFDAKGKRKRAESLFYKEPITVHQVSNVIHVLFGERPKPSLREVAFGNVDYYYKKALQSYLKINSYKRKITDKKTNVEREEFISEMLQTKKVVQDAWSTNFFMYWERVSKMLGKDMYNEFTSLLSKLFEVKDITEKYSFMDLREEVIRRGMISKPEEKNTKKTSLDIFFDKLVESKKSSLVTYFLYDKRRNEINKAANIKVTVNIGTERVTKISGEIIIPVSEEDISKLSKHKGCATILDGGIVFIKGLLNENEVNVSSHTKVSEISTDKY
jgi:hypothetical protein